MVQGSTSLQKARSTALPIEEHRFCLSKGSFRDALSLRYGWPILNVSSKCACGSTFSVDHAMICHKGGIPTLPHNEVRDLTAELLAETAPGVSTEPRLQPLHDEVFQLRSANREDDTSIYICICNLHCIYTYMSQNGEVPLMFTTRDNPAWLKRWRSLEAGETSSQ